MFIFKLISLNNILFYFVYFVMIVFVLFLSYKYLYLEQSIYLMSNKLNKLEIELNNPSLCSNTINNKKINDTIKNADIVMNEIFNSENSANILKSSSAVCSISGICNNISNSHSNSPSNNSSSNSSSISSLSQVQAEEIVPVTEDENIVNEIFDLKKDNDDKESSISNNIVGGGHSVKKTLMKLSIDKLKAKCEERKLSTEGTKNQLADRIIVHDNTVEITDT